MRPSGGTGTRHYQCVHWPDQRRIYYLPSSWIMLQIGLKVKLWTHAIYSTSHRWFRVRPDILAVIFCILLSWKTLWSSLTYLWSISRRLFPGSTQGHTDDFLVTFLRILMTVWNPDNISVVLLFVSVLLLLFKFVFGSCYKPKQNWCLSCMNRIASSRKNSIWNCHVYMLYVGIRNTFVAKQVLKGQTYKTNHVWFKKKLHFTRTSKKDCRWPGSLKEVGGKCPIYKEIKSFLTFFLRESLNTWTFPQAK